jgi:hypothetical protein
MDESEEKGRMVAMVAGPASHSPGFPPVFTMISQFLAPPAATTSLTIRRCKSAGREKPVKIDIGTRVPRHFLRLITVLMTAAEYIRPMCLGIYWFFLSYWKVTLFRTQGFK